MVPPSMLSARMTPAVTISDPLAGSVICFSASRTLSLSRVTLIMPLDGSGHHMFHIYPIER